MSGGNETTGSGFVLLGLFPGLPHPGILMCLTVLSYVLALAANTTLTVLIALDARLHNPMYFLLSQLSLVDLLFISTTVPRMAADFFLGTKTISSSGCGTQLFIYLALGGAECLLLTCMACDRYMAICRPLRYPVLMNRKTCLSMAVGSWAGGSLNSLVQTVYTMRLPKCGRLEIDHFFCEVMAVLRLSCGDTLTYRLTILGVGIVLLLVPFGIIFTSYAVIFLTVLRVSSREGRRKALATCSSHLVVVSLFYGPTVFIYMTPGSTHSPAQEQAMSVFFAIVTPTLNPLVYSLRNRDVLEALRKALRPTALLSPKVP
ncbi:olfactory receptor 2AJ1-like [Lepus europaeus]|uniref:olfactory receptor 2AJ1-like n=1 Tax=Lepus europaeus TaxID=9983 RepID=UPI002B474507|nr:olfactory receptor 2AJ1-like [Lepus europaeus]